MCRFVLGTDKKQSKKSLRKAFFGVTTNQYKMLTRFNHFVTQCVVLQSQFYYEKIILYDKHSDIIILLQHLQIYYRGEI